jgi:sugar phosphate permease
MLKRSDSAISNAYEIEAAHARRRTMAILYVAYGFFYLPRKADSVTKSALVEHAGFAMEDLALSDTVYLSVYTISLLFSGVRTSVHLHRCQLFFAWR